MRTQSLFLALALALTLTACGGGSDPAALNTQGYEALNSAKYAEAVTHFDAALAAIGDNSSDAQYLRAHMGRIEANVHENPESAKQDFLSLASSSSSVGAKDYSRIGGLLADAGEFLPAIDVVDAGIKAYPETPALSKVMDKIKADAEKAGNSEAISALQGLGYLGD